MPEIAAGTGPLLDQPGLWCFQCFPKGEGNKAFVFPHSITPNTNVICVMVVFFFAF